MQVGVRQQVLIFTAIFVAVAGRGDGSTICYYCSAYWSMFNNEQDFSFDFKQFFSPLTTKKAILIIVVIGFIVFANSLFNGFVLDDNSYIVHNPADVQVFNIQRLFGANHFNEGGQYRPISALYFAVLYQGEQTFFYHSVQVALHIVNTILFYLLLKKFLNNYISLFLSLIFLVHPMNVESVSWISGALSVLFFLFGMLALLLSFKDEINFLRLTLISLLLLLSLLSKETGVFFVFLVPLLRILYRKKHTFVFIVSSLVVLLIYLAMRFLAIGFQYTMNYYPAIEHLTFMQRVFTMPEVVFYYIHTFLFPLNLAERQNWTITTPNFQNFYFPLSLDLIFFLGIILLGFNVYKHHREHIKVFILFFFWFVAGLGLLTHVVPLDATVADRWMYFPMAGLLGLIGVGINNIHFSRSSVKRTAAIATVILIGILSGRTIMRNTNYFDQKTILTHDIQVVDDESKEADLGYLLLDKGMREQAYQHFEKAVELNPRAKSLLWQFNWVGNRIKR